MRFLVDENLPHEVADELSARGFDVAWVVTRMSGADDPDLVEVAKREERILVTHDKDFGDLAFVHGLAPPGIVLIRFPPMDRSLLALRVALALRSRDDWTGFLSVIEPGRIRRRRLLG